MSLRLDNNIINQKATPAFYSDIIANRPAAGFAGRIFISTDSGQIFEDTGTTWSLIADAGVGGGTLSSVCLNGNTTATGIVITAGGLSTNSLTDTTLTSGSVIFADGGGLLTQSNASFFWDNTNKRLGIGTNSPSATLDVHGTGVNAQFNGTGTNNAYLQFQNAGTNKWRIGNTYNAGANTLDIINNSLSSTALSFNITTNAATFNNSITATSFIKTGGTSSQFLKADGSVDSNSYITLGSLSATSPVQYNNTTGVISILQAGASQSGYLSSTDWNTFNNKASLGSLSASSPLLYNSGTGAFSIQVANSGQSGYLSNTDWNTFNNKQNTITTGNLTETSSSILTISGGTGAVIGSGTTIAVQQSSATTNGYLSSTDWNTFNNKATPLNGVGFVKVSGTTISYDNSTYYLASNPSNFITLSSLAASSPLVYNNTTGGFSIQVATTSQNGYLSSTDWNTFNNKQGALTLTTTGTSGAATLIGNTLNIPQYSGTPAGSNTQIQFNNSGAFGASANFTFNSTSNQFTVSGSQTASAGVARGTIISPTLVAAANSDVLSAVYINPTFTNGAFTGVSNNGLIVANGNVGIGATPSGLWSNLWSVSQLGQAISLFSYKSGSNYGGIINNTYSVGGSYQTGNARYINNGYALSYIQSNSGEHIWLSAASGTAGDVVTWSQSMTINASGYLGIGLSTIGSKLQVNGNAAIGYSSSTAAPTNGLAVSGNLGIGTTSPFAILTSVAPNLGAIGLGIVGRPSDDFGLITFRKNDATTTVLEIGGNIANGFFIKNYADTFTYFSTNATERMRITSGGKVLIGTTTDNSQGTLQNNGTFYTLGLAMGGTTFSTNTTATYTNVFYYFNGGTGITLTLPAANAKSNYYIIKNGSANALTIAANGSDTFIAAGTIVTVSTLTLASGASTTIICNGTVNWIQIS